MSCVPEELWRTAPALLQQARRCHLEACAGRRARRALFGQPDRDETRRFVKEELAAIRAADQQKYNFDFSAMRPLSGAYEWQPVMAGEVSAAYQLGRLQSGLAQQQQHRSARRLHREQPSAGQPRPPVPSGDSSDSRSGSSSSSPLTEALARRASPPPRPATAAPRQSSITDFMRSRKRPSGISCGDASTAKRTSVPASAPATSAATQPGAGHSGQPSA